MESEWIERLYGCKQQLDRKNIEEKFNWIYERAGLPKVRVFCADSPDQAKRMVTAIQDDVRDQDHLKSLSNEDLVRMASGKPVTEYGWAWYCDVGDYGWVDELDRRDKNGEKQQDAFYPYRDLLKCNVFASFQFNEVAIVIDMPVELNWIEWMGRRVPHSTTTAAIRFRDGYSEYFWRGIKIPGKCVTDPDNFTREDILSEKNAERRRAVREVLGTKRFMTALDVTVLDEQIDHQGNVMKLLRTKEKDDIVEDFIYFYNCLCPSTQREYCLCVPGVDERYPDGIRNVWDAKAWTFRMKAAEYETDIET